MYLVEIFLPITDNEGRTFSDAAFAVVRGQLTSQFGGVTAFSRAPAHGITAEGDKPVHDDIVIMQVMVYTLDRSWWRDYRRTLEEQFRQDEILIRATETEKL